MNWIGVSISWSNNPQKKATIGIKYVTEVAKTGDDNWINLKKRILAIPVPTIPSIAMYAIDVWTFGIVAISKNPEKYNNKIAGVNKTKKFPVVILRGATLGKYFLIKFTLVA